MGKLNGFFTLSALVFNLLFYRNLPGVNYLLFGLVVIGGLLSWFPAMRQSRPFLVISGAYFLAGVSVLLHGHVLSAIACWFTLAVLAGIKLNPASSVLVSLANTLYSTLLAPIDWLLKRQSKRSKVPVVSATPASKGRRIAIFLPVVLTLLFAGLYMGANPLFENLVLKFNWDFLTWAWIGLFLVGFTVTVILFKTRSIPGLTEYDAQPELETTYLATFNHKVKRLINDDQEWFSGMLLLVLLNGLLLLVNGLDVYHLYIKPGIPEGMTKAEFVHQGVGNLITSIVLAIAIILFYFRGQHQVDGQRYQLRWAAYAWIAQNAFLIVSTGVRNTLYVQEFSLTYERVGVYVYLLMALFGLLFTLVKLMKAQPNWYLVRNFGWACLGTLIAASFINWDARITAFNIHHARENSSELDVKYLLSLGYGNLPQLRYLANKPGQVDFNMAPEILQLKVNKQANAFQSEWEAIGWPSWCWTKDNVYERLQAAEDDQER
jgi:hypothetical protein